MRRFRLPSRFLSQFFGLTSILVIIGMLAPQSTAMAGSPLPAASNTNPVFIPLVSQPQFSAPGVMSVDSPAKMDESLPLTEMSAAPVTTNPQDHLGTLKKMPSLPVVTNGVDPVSQGNNPSLQTPVGFSRLLDFPGVGMDDYGFIPPVAPPDTTLAVGDTQVVQWVNNYFAVFDKATGDLIYGPIAGNAIWRNFGGGCETNNDGDILVQWDQLASRWIFTQFSVSTTPYLQCMAVSKTSDATGAFYRSALQYTDFNDYPKIGVWPDAYYITYNMFTGGTTWRGARLCALERAKMILGQGYKQVCFQYGVNVGSVLPSDLEGSTLPPAGAPNYMLYLMNTSQLEMMKFHVDFTTPANSSISWKTINVASFTPTCNAGAACVVQPRDSTNSMRWPTG